jgi:hypothetical protein
MRVNRFQFLPVLLFAATIQPASAGSQQPAVASAATYPQIVRLSYVEGDVRISRGKLADKQDAQQEGRSTGWEKAEVNLSLQSGYSLVTGKGRAEIEFEDASTVYLAENSVLTLDDLTSTAGIPRTEIALLSGTATVNVHNLVPGESFDLATPTDRLYFRYPYHAVWRIDSYIDAVSITPQPDPATPPAELTRYQADVVGKTSTYRHGLRQMPVSAAVAHVPPDWDAWVAARIDERHEAIAATMKQAGLSAPIPGLAEMNGQGHFFACEPYGTCWEPTNGWAGHVTQVADTKETTQAGKAVQAVAADQRPAEQGTASTGPRPGAPATHGTKQSAADAYLSNHPGAILTTEDYLFPCSTFAVQDLIATDPVTGRQTLVQSVFDTSTFPFDFGLRNIAFRNFAGYPGRGFGLFLGYDAWGYPYAPWEWAVCHSGSWIRWHRHYVWVAGTRRHHHRPIRWVKRGREVGFVPIHPRDVTGKQPLNLRDGLFKLTGKKDQPVQRVAFTEGADYKLLDDAPKEFRKPVLEPLATAEAPHPEAYSAYQVALASQVPLPGGGGTALKGTAFAAGHGTPILFDRRSQTFSVAQQVNNRGRTETFAQPLGGRGVYQGAQPSQSGSAQSRSSFSSGGYSNNAGASRPSYSAPSYNSGAGAASVSHAAAPAPSFSAPSSAPAPAAASSSSPHK